MRNRYAGWIAGFIALLLGFGLARLRQVHEAAVGIETDSPIQADAAPARPPPSDQWQAIVAKSVAQRNSRRDSRRHPTAMPTGPFGASVAELEQLARAGDAEAAAALAKGFRDCEFFRPATSQEEATKRVEEATARELAFTDQLVGEVQRIAAEQGKRVEIPALSTRSAMQRQLDAQSELAVRCAGVDPDAAHDWPRWVRRATELGDRDAELSYWQLVIQHADVETPDELVTDKRIALGALQDALGRGDARALAAIGETLARGEFAEPDPYSAYAYFFAAAQAPVADSSTLPWMNMWNVLFTGGNTQGYFERKLRELDASLTAAQRLDAQQAGLALYQQCCSGTGR